MEIDSVLSRFLLRNHCRVQCIPMMFVLPSVVSEHSSRLIGDSTVRRATVFDGSRRSFVCCHPHDTLSRGFRCVLIFSLCGHVSRIWGFIRVAVDFPVYEPLVGVVDTSGPGEDLCFVGLCGDSYCTLSEHRVSNLDTDLKGT